MVLSASLDPASASNPGYTFPGQHFSPLNTPVAEDHSQDQHADTEERS